MIQRKHGFSLIEVSIVLVIIGIISAFSIQMFGSRLDSANYTNTKERMETIIDALGRYYAANGKLPCPARADRTLGDPEYGVAIFSDGTPPDTGCDESNPVNQTAILNFPHGNDPLGTVSLKVTIAAPGEWLRQGAVPTRTLGISDEMMFDSFNRKFTYVMTEKFNTGPIDGMIVINDGFSGTPVTTAAAFALISHGKDGKGAYTRGNSIGIPCFAQPGLDNQNCDPDQVFTQTQFNDLNRGAANWFDDLIMWQDKNTVIGLKSSTNAGLSIKFTAAVTKGGLIIDLPAGDDICEGEYHGYRFCTHADLARSGPSGELPDTGHYYGSIGWIAGGSDQCGAWNGGADAGNLLTPAAGGWILTTAGDCSALHRVACCRQY